jgi:beta-barrel assembly-enhancing protease
MVRYSEGGSPQWRAFKIRAFIALLLALFTLVSYLMKGDINPITGEKQRVGMSVDQEIVLGLEARSEMAAQHGGLHADAAVRADVSRVGHRLVDALHQDLSQTGKTDPYQFDFHLLADDQTINAFALPGGQVFITYALYSQLTTEGQLAGVLGHEVGHVVNRHSAQRVAKMELTQGLAGAAGVAGGSRSSAEIAAMVGNLVNMKYGRSDELEADLWGVKLSVLAGYDPRAMLGVMEILDKAGGGKQPELLSTHPKPANRKEYIDEVIREVFPSGVPEGLHE